MITQEQYDKYRSQFTEEQIDADPAISAGLDLMYSSIPVSKDEKRAYTAFKKDSSWECSQEVLLTGIQCGEWDCL